MHQPTFGGVRQLDLSQRLEQIASGIGTSTHELKSPVIKLLASKTLAKKGERRGTMYFAGGRKK